MAPTGRQREGAETFREFSLSENLFVLLLQVTAAVCTASHRDRSLCEAWTKTNEISTQYLS